MRDILKEINNQGYEAYLVGGYPRDYYLGIESTDYDICTNASIETLTNIFTEYKLVGFNSIIVKYNGIDYQITPYRIEYDYIDNRHPSNIIYTNNLYDDLCRRDFIINTLCMDSDNNYIDLMGARRDIDNKIIRSVGNPEIKLQEDCLRIIRAIRFATILNFKIEDSLICTIRKYGYLLNNLSITHKRRELDKIFESNNREYGIKLLIDCNLINYLDIDKLPDIVLVDDIYGIWAQLDVESIYSFTKEEKKRINSINELLNKDSIDILDMYYNGIDICKIVSKIKGLDIDKIIASYNSLSIKNISDIKININDIVACLNTSYERARELLHDIEIKIINNELVNDRDILIGYVLNK